MILNGVASPLDVQVPNMFSLFGSQTSVLPPWGTYLRDVLGAKTAAVVYPEQAGADTAAQGFVQGLEEAGIDYTLVSYNPDQPDVIGALAAAGVDDADAFIPSGDQASCIAIAKALEQTGSTTPVVSGPLCLAPDVAAGLGDLPKWTYGIAQSLPGDPTSPDSAGLPRCVGYGRDGSGERQRLLGARLQRGPGRGQDDERSSAPTTSPSRGWPTL